MKKSKPELVAALTEQERVRVGQSCFQALALCKMMEGNTDEADDGTLGSALRMVTVSRQAIRSLILHSRTIARCFMAMNYPATLFVTPSTEAEVEACSELSADFLNLSSVEFINGSLDKNSYLKVVKIGDYVASGIAAKRARIDLWHIVALAATERFAADDAAAAMQLALELMAGELLRPGVTISIKGAVCHASEAALTKAGFSKQVEAGAHEGSEPVYCLQSPIT